MKKTKFISLLFALMLVVTSLTSCLSNSNENSGPQVLADLLYCESFGTFTSINTGNTLIATNGSNLSSGHFYWVYYTINTNTTGNSSKATGTASTYSITIQQATDGTLAAYKVGGGYTNNDRAIDLNTFKDDTTTVLKDSLKNEASFISLNATNTDQFYIWKNDGSYTLLTGLNYFFDIPDQSSKDKVADILNNNKFYLYYDQNKLSDGSGTLHLYLKRFTNNTSNKQYQVLISNGYGSTFQDPRLYYKTFSIDEALSAYRSANGNMDPTSVVVTVNINPSDWKVLNTSSTDYKVSFK